MRTLRLTALAAALGLAVTTYAAETPTMPKEGDKAPAIDLPATQIDKALPEKKGAKSLSLADLKGKNVVLFFYPKALTGG